MRTAKTGLAEAERLLAEADDANRSARQAADEARKKADEARVRFERGELTRDQLEEARKLADAAAAAARTESENLRKLVVLQTEPADLPEGHRGIGAGTADLTLRRGGTGTIGNVRFACDAESPVDCTIAFVEDEDGNLQYRRNRVLVTASVVFDPVAERLLSAVAQDNPSTFRYECATNDNMCVFNNAWNDVTIQVGETEQFRVQIAVVGAPLSGVTNRDNNLWRLYAGTENDRPDGHDGFPAWDLRVDGNPQSLATSWSITSLDGMKGVSTVTEFAAADSNLPESER